MSRREHFHFEDGGVRKCRRWCVRVVWVLAVNVAVDFATFPAVHEAWRALGWGG